MWAVVSRWSLVVSLVALSAATAYADAMPRRKPCKPDTVKIYVRDTITVTKLIFIRDTTKLVLIRETQPVYNYIAMMPTLKVEQPAPIIEKYMLNLYGGANTNGYNVLLGATVYLGSRVSFFGGLGTIYNATTKETHLDLGGYMVIRLSEP